MRIAEFILTLKSGGAERFTVDLANEMARAGHEVVLCVLCDIDSRDELSFFLPEVSDKVEIKKFGFRPDVSLREMREVKRFLDDWRPDAVHSNLVHPFYLLPGILGRRYLTVETLHNLAEKCLPGRMHYYFYKPLYRLGKFVPVTISEECEKSFQALYGGPRVKVITNGRTPLSPGPAFDSVRNEVARLKTNASTPVFCHVARCTPQKNQRLLIDSFNRLDALGRDFCLLVIGRDYDKGEGVALQKDACSKIHFLGEKLNIGDYMLASDAFVLSSAYEGLPITLLEAMSGGLVPVCTPVGGIPDVVTDGETAILAADLTVAGFTSALVRYLESDIDRDKIKGLFQESYSMERCAKEYISYFRTLLKTQ